MNTLRKITIEGLKKRASTSALRSYLGEDLFPWLCPGNGFPKLPGEAGSVILLFANKGETAIPGLGEGILLPVEWRPGEHSTRLPRGILEVADDVRTRLEDATHTDPEARRFGLHLPRWIEADISELGLQGGSIFVPLAAALVAARTGRGRPLVFSTGSWDTTRNRIGSVEGYEQKIGAIARLASCVPQHASSDWLLFVPEDDLEKATTGDLASPVALHPIRSRGPYEGGQLKDHLLRSLSDLLSAYAVAPNGADELDVHIQYFNRPDVQANKESAFKHYAAFMARKLGEESMFEGEVLDPPQGRPLAMSFNPNNKSLTLLTLHALKPSRILFLFSDDDQTRERFGVFITREFDLSGVEIDSSAVKAGEHRALIARIAEFLTPLVSSGKTSTGMVEITGGLSMHKALLTLAASASGARIVNVDQNDGSRILTTRKPRIHIHDLTSAPTQPSR